MDILLSVAKARRLVGEGKEDGLEVMDERAYIEVPATDHGLVLRTTQAKKKKRWIRVNVRRRNKNSKRWRRTILLNEGELDNHDEAVGVLVCRGDGV